jgi:hypothetical protein
LEGSKSSRTEGVWGRSFKALASAGSRNRVAIDGSTIEAEIRSLIRRIRRRLFSRLKLEYCEFKPYNPERL